MAYNEKLWAVDTQQPRRARVAAGRRVFFFVLLLSTWCTSGASAFLPLRVSSPPPRHADAAFVALDAAVQLTGQKSSWRPAYQHGIHSSSSPARALSLHPQYSRVYTYRCHTTRRSRNPSRPIIAGNILRTSHRRLGYRPIFRGEARGAVGQYNNNTYTEESRARDRGLGFLARARARPRCISSARSTRALHKMKPLPVRAACRLLGFS